MRRSPNSCSGGRTSELARRKAAICYFNAAHMGHSRAQLCLALAYEQGDGIEQDAGKALHWAAVAADQSLAEAEFVVGCFYAVGVGIVPNQLMAALRLERAAAGGYLLANVVLGWIYESGGSGVAANRERALAFYAQAAEAGSSRALAELARIRENGFRASLAEAETWWQILRALVVRREGPTGKWCPGLAESLDALSLDDCRDLASIGLGAAQWELAVRFEHGVGAGADPDLALLWCGRAARQGFARAQYVLACKYLDGIGVTADHAQALNWCRQAAGQGHAGAQLLIGRLYRDGIGVRANSKWSKSWYSRALAQCILGHDLQERFEIDAGAEIVDEDRCGALYRLDKSDPQILALRLWGRDEEGVRPLDSFYLMPCHLSTVAMAMSSLSRLRARLEGTDARAISEDQL